MTAPHPASVPGVSIIIPPFLLSPHHAWTGNVLTQQPKVELPRNARTNRTGVRVRKLPVDSYRDRSEDQPGVTAKNPPRRLDVERETSAKEGVAGGQEPAAIRRGDPAEDIPIPGQRGDTCGVEANDAVWIQRSGAAAVRVLARAGAGGARRGAAQPALLQGSALRSDGAQRLVRRGPACTAQACSSTALARSAPSQGASSKPLPPSSIRPVE